MRRKGSLIGRLEHDGARTVAEQHAGAAVVPVEDAREGLCADHQRTLVGAGANELVGDAEGVDEAAADRLQVEGRRAVGDAQLALQDRGGAGENVIRRRSGQHDQVDVVRLAAGRLERPLAGNQRQVAGCDIRRREMAGTDAGTFDDPLVRGVEPLGGDQRRVADRFSGQTAAGAGDA
jgi:hypothetical protein